jgi:hypothetical protein
VTVLVAARDARRAGRWRRSPLTQLAWVSWRQHRGTLIGLAAFTVTDGLWAQGVTDPLGSCVPPSSPVPCQLFLNGQLYGVWYSGILVPIAVGTFVGAPLLAREYASGTTRFAWTQGTGRTRPTVAQLILVALAVLAAAAVLCLAVGVLAGVLTQLHDTFWVTYQPVSRYWLFQSIQGGAELLFALVLGALAVWLVQRRKA